MYSSARLTLSKGKKKSVDALSAPPAWSATAFPSMSMTGEPELPPDELAAA